MRWLLLLHQLPSEPAYARVKIHRRLRAVGAVGLKNGAHVLPDTESAREDLQWILREVQANGGEGTVGRMEILAGSSGEELAEAFVADRNQEYAQIAAEAEVALAGGVGRAQVQRLRRRLGEVVDRDHLQAPGRSAAERAVDALEGGRPQGDPGLKKLLPVPISGWVTRRGVKVDRMGSAWLILRFIDAAARFRFVDADAYELAAGEVRFDMYEGEFTHEGETCTFETLLEHYALRDPAVRAIGEMIHDIDLKDGRFGREETAGIAKAVSGITAMYERDEDRIAAALPLFDGLYASFRSQ